VNNLFQLGDFKLHSGEVSFWKIDCDALTDEDWKTLARIAYMKLIRFRKVIGIAKGGLKFAESLKPYCFPNPEYPILIVDDVLTTGTSMEESRKQIQGEAIGCVVFARNLCPPIASWVTALFYCR
jgi:orotate phosphoribosyltransferase